MDLIIPAGTGSKETPGGCSNDPVMAHHREHGFQGVASKPYRLHELCDTVEEVLRSWPAGMGGGRNLYSGAAVFPR